MKNKSAKRMLLLCTAVFSFLFLLPLMNAQAVSVDEVILQLEEIDTLEQMQEKRKAFTVNKHYNPSNATIVASHQTAAQGYETYVEEMFAARKNAQEAFDSLSDEEKALIPSSLKEKLNNTLDTVFKPGSYSVNKSSDEYSYQIISPGFLVYELSSAFIKTGDVAGTFVVIDADTDEESFNLDTPYSYGAVNYDLAYCCDLFYLPKDGTHYKRTNLENSGYYGSESAKKSVQLLKSLIPSSLLRK